MKKLLPLLALLFLASGINAQNWNPYNPGFRNYYTNVHGYLRTMELDSIIAAGNDLYYHPYLRLHLNSAGYSEGQLFVPDTIGSWLGRFAVKRPNGVFYISNHWHDTIIIKPLAAPGESWIFYRDSSSVYYTAEVTSVDTMTVLGSIDSVKKILLHAYDNGNLLPSDSFDNTELVLSKNHGFQTIMELYYFPFHLPDTSQQVDDYYFTNSMTPPNIWPGGSVAGKTNCMFHLIDFVNPPASQFIDWNVGDIYQYDACYISMVTGFGYCDPPYNYRLDTIISKSVTSSGVEYVRRGWKAREVHLNNTNIVSHYDVWPTQDTIFFSATGSYFQDIGVTEKWDGNIFGTAGWLNYYQPGDTGFCTQSAAYYKWAFSFALAGGSRIYEYKQGLGLVMNDVMQHDNFTMYGHDDLIYYVKNGVACGNYVFPDTSAPVSVHSLHGESRVSIYPNPATDLITIECLEGGYAVSLINSIGQVVVRKDDCTPRESIDIRSCANGVYVLKIETADKQVANRKIIIQH